MQKPEIYTIQTKYTSIAEFHSRANVARYLRKCGNLPIWEILVITWLYDRPPAPQVYQCKITKSTGMATRMQLEVILEDSIATRVL